MLARHLLSGFCPGLMTEFWHARMAAQLASSAPLARGADPASLGEVALALALVVAAIVILAWVLRRVQRGIAAAGSSRLRVVASLALGPRERLVVVDAAGTQLLLGVTPAGISRLHELSDPLVVAAPSPNDFAQRLRQALRGVGPE